VIRGLRKYAKSAVKADGLRDFPHDARLNLDVSWLQVEVSRYEGSYEYGE
jgi:hypothetical protein